MKAQTKESQAAISPQQSIDLLMEGNARFLNKGGVSRDLIQQVSETATGQYPFSSVLSCIDSRIPTEIIFDQGIGDIFNARIAGNFINEDILGSLEFACQLAGSKSIMILGHTSCGGVKGACDDAKLGNLTQMLAKIKPAVERTKTEEGEARNSSNIHFVNRVAEENVRLNVKAITEKSTVLNNLVEQGDLIIVGAMYDVASGKVTLL